MIEVIHVDHFLFMIHDLWGTRCIWVGSRYAKRTKHVRLILWELYFHFIISFEITNNLPYWWKRMEVCLHES